MIGHNLASMRKLNNMTLEAVAEAIGVSRQAVAKWEAGITKPDIENCKAQLAFGNAALSDDVKQNIRDTKAYQEGRSVLVEIRTAEDVETVMQLLQTKMT